MSYSIVGDLSSKNVICKFPTSHSVASNTEPLLNCTHTFEIIFFAQCIYTKGYVYRHVYKTDEITRNKIFQDCRQYELTTEKPNTTLCIIRSNEYTLGRFTLECRIEMYCTVDFRMQLRQIYNNILIV